MASSQYWCLYWHVSKMITHFCLDLVLNFNIESKLNVGTKPVQASVVIISRYVSKRTNTNC